ncbi:MAG: hypothetical protein PWP20_1588 [Eubacteriaceae bacterium]|nr:hypothetical protein [Eubacteriaceae bacterium]
MEKKQIQKTIIMIFLAVCMAVFAELFFQLIENKLGMNQLFKPSGEWFESLKLKRMLAMTVLFAGVLLTLIAKKRDQILAQLYQKRFLVAAVFLVICVIFELSGSFIAVFKCFGGLPLF